MGLTITGRLLQFVPGRLKHTYGNRINGYRFFIINYEILSPAALPL